MPEKNSLEELKKRAQENQSAADKEEVQRQARIAKWKIQETARLEKYAARAVSPLVNKLRMNLFMKTAAFTLWIITIMLTIPYLMYLKHPVAVSGHTLRAGDYTFDPSKDGFGLMYFGIAVSIVMVTLVILWFVGLAGTKANLAKEKLWVASLPFPVKGYFEALGKETDRYYVKIRFIEYPETKFIGNLLTGLDRNHIQHNRGINSPDELKIDLDSFWPAYSKSGYRMHLLIHRIVNEILIPLNKDFPVKSLTVNEDDLNDDRTSF